MNDTMNIERESRCAQITDLTVCAGTTLPYSCNVDGNDCSIRIHTCGGSFDSLIESFFGRRHIQSLEADGSPFLPIS